MSRADVNIKKFKQSMYGTGCPVYCCYCAKNLPYEEATVEHVMPIWRGGRKSSKDNMLIACSPCNHQKSVDDIITFWKGHSSQKCVDVCVCSIKNEQANVNHHTEKRSA